MIDYPAGRTRRITNDLNIYRAIGLTQDGKKLTTVQSQGLVNLWIVPEGEAKKAVRLPTGNVSGFFSAGGSNLSWTPDDRIVYVSNESGKSDIWLTDTAGAHRKQLTANNGINVSPAVTPDGRYVVFASWQESRKNLWRMNLDGSNPAPLTSGLGDSFPAISPDSRWVIYTVNDGVKPTLWKVSIDGGTPVQITNHAATAGAVSPDGKWIAYTYTEAIEPFAPPNRIAVMPFEGGAAVTTLKMPASGTVQSVLHWARDSKSILYTLTANNLTNVWSQPLDGGSPKQITEFKEMLMTGFSWSRDGKQLACTRGTLIRDAILITDVK